MSIRWKLFASHVLVVLVAVVILGLYLSHELGQRYLRSLEEGLFSQASLIREQVSAVPAQPDRRAGLNALARRLGGETRVRITLIARDGTVLADNEHDPGTMENHRWRPEVRQALARGRGRSLRYSYTLGVDMLYVALAARHKDAPVAVVRLAMPLRQVGAAVGRVRSLVLTAVLVALAMAVLLSLKLAQGMSNATRELGRAARELAAGKLEAQVRLPGNDELATLAATFNEMASRLRTMVRELREEKRRVTTIVERLGEAILVTDPAGRITMCNLAAGRVFGIACERALGLGVVDATQNYPLDQAFREVLSAGGVRSVEVEVLFPQPRTLEATVTAFPAEEPLGAVAVLHDVTELRKLEAVRREFVANASHELQTPITAIKAMAETLLSGGREDRALTERFLRDLDQQADRLGALVKDLLDLAGLEAGPLALEPVELSLAEVARSVAGQLEPLAHQRGVSVSVEVPEDLMVVADHSALVRILTNLLDNAIKYTEPGGQAGIRAARQEQVVTITVWDTGIGIPSTDLPHVFERFYRVDKARSRELGGTGLGLSIAKHLAEALGGQLFGQSRLGKGSQFTISGQWLVSSGELQPPTVTDH